MLSAHDDDVKQIDFIRQNFGGNLAKYVKNKNKGGRRNEKGGAFENFFAVFKIAKLAPCVFEDRIDILLSSQVPCFVDDLIIDNPRKKHRENYQLKNCKELSWNGKHPLCDDFENQNRLNQLQEIKSSKIILVVPNDSLRKTLVDNKPKMLDDFSEVDLFSYNDGGLAAVIDSNPDFLIAIQKLCKSERPSKDMVEAVANILLGAWVSGAKNRKSLAEVVLTAKNLSPSMIRSWGPVAEIRPQVKKILNKIDGFHHAEQRGFLHWNYLNGLEVGCLPYDCNDPKFTKFQDVIERQQPTTFDDLEGMLI